MSIDVATTVVDRLRSALAAMGAVDARAVVLTVHASGRVRPVASRAGRVAVAAALDALGEHGRPSRDEHGRPVWPAGTTGAVAHGAGLAVAVCVRTDGDGPVRTLGVDVERMADVGERVARRVALPGDRGPSSPADEHARAVRFSAKEAAYKALSFASAPALAGFSFAGVTVQCDDDGTFGAVGPDGRAVEGRWFLTDGVVVTVASHEVGRTADR